MGYSVLHSLPINNAVFSQFGQWAGFGRPWKWNVTMQNSEWPGEPMTNNRKPQSSSKTVSSFSNIHEYWCPWPKTRTLGSGCKYLMDASLGHLDWFSLSLDNFSNTWPPPLEPWVLASYLWIFCTSSLARPQTPWGQRPYAVHHCGRASPASGSVTLSKDLMCARTLSCFCHIRLCWPHGL